MKIIRKGRRPTTLPAVPIEPRLMAATFSAAMKQHYTEPILTQLYGNASPLFGTFEPDPWDEAVKWIEQRHVDKKEWPWPTR